jgi:hypothetical protein
VAGRQAGSRAGGQAGDKPLAGRHGLQGREAANHLIQLGAAAAREGDHGIIDALVLRRRDAGTAATIRQFRCRGMGLCTRHHTQTASTQLAGRAGGRPGALCRRSWQARNGAHPAGQPNRQRHQEQQPEGKDDRMGAGLVFEWPVHEQQVVWLQGRQSLGNPRGQEQHHG